MTDALYTIVERFRIEARCSAPLHVGSAGGEKEEVLVHPVRNVPFIQASSLAGVLRDYYEDTFGSEEAAELFGSSRDTAEAESRIRVFDGFFKEDEPVRMEVRPHVAINRETGTAAESKLKGSSIRSGHKFETEYVGVGNCFSFELETASNEIYEEKIKACLEAMNAGEIQVGGHKSSGCGYIESVSAAYDRYDMRDAQQRQALCAGKDAPAENHRKLKLAAPPEKRMAYTITLYGKTEGELLVKDIAPEGYGEGYADAVNIRDADGNDIIPGSSLKGVIRSRMEMIAAYKGLPEHVIGDAFGVVGERPSDGRIGNLRFSDTAIGTKEENTQMPNRTRIHIDKFTGGVMHQALFSEKNAAGEVVMKMAVTAGKSSEDGRRDHEADMTLALTVLALRDLAVKAYQIGSGYSIGKGYIDVERIEITAKDAQTALLDFKTGTVRDSGGLLSRCLKCLEVCG